jgi:hypothetical protein
VQSLELRPRLASELVDAAFQLYRRHFPELVTLSALSFAPYIVVELLVQGTQPIDPANPSTWVFLLLLVGWLFGSLMEAATVLAVSNSYLHGAPDVAGTLRATLARFGTILFAIAAKWFLIGLAFMAGLLFAGLAALAVMIGAGMTGGGGAVPAAPTAFLMVFLVTISLPLGLFMFARYFAVPATIVLEGLGVGAGLRRSRELSKGIKGRIIGALGIPMLLVVAIPLVLTGVLALLPLPRFLTFLVEQAVTVVAYPIVAVIATLLYYDARIRREGFDIERMAAELGGGNAVASPSIPPSLPN